MIICRADSRMKFNNVELNPAKNPAVLDTVTWDRRGAWAALLAVDEDYWESLRAAVRQSGHMPRNERCVAYTGSAAEYRNGLFVLVGLKDNQHVFVELRDKVGQWIDANWDHAFLVNDNDQELIDALNSLKEKKYFIFHNENPTAEVLAKHLYGHVKDLYGGLVSKVRIWEWGM